MRNNMFWKRRGPMRYLPFLLLVPLFVLLVGSIVMMLWNAILPALFHVSMITFWQAIGLLVLSKILFSSFRPGGGWHKHGPSGYMREKWINMSEEEKAEFREQWKRRCGGWQEEKS